MKNKIIVYAYVCGDIIHKGHLLHLKNAAALGNFLIVGVLTDRAVMEKKKKPIISFEERLEIVSSLKMVSMAVPQDTYSPHENVRALKPDILIESQSHDEELINKSRECMEEIGGDVFVMPYFPEQSSTNIKKKIGKMKREKDD